MKNLLLLSLLLISSLASAQPKAAPTPQIAIKLEQGTSITLKGKIISFETVIEDSRCPKYTNCVWAGQAVVQLKVTNQKGLETQRKIIIGAAKGNESENRVLYKNGNYTIEVIDLLPYPEEGAEKSPYILLLKEHK